jgi:formylglycine-generating enzyme required for sulfatase activity
MALVDGDYCPALGQICLHELGGPVARCQEFAKNAQCAGRIEHKRFCIDRYEYPNQPGVKPAVMVTWDQAKATCEGEGKRLCTDSEWTLACEGEERRPYPYGYERDANACNIDHELPVPNEAALADPRRAAEEAARLDQRVPSGAMNRCTSPYGVHDMTGNVDEWVVNERHFTVPAEDPSRPFVSGLKGGYWGPVRNRCRPMTTAHNETFRYYQIGFRCCAGTGE